VASQYPKNLVARQVGDISRTAFHINLALGSVSHKPHSEVSLCDLGGGISLFPVGCASCGIKRTVLIDNFYFNDGFAQSSILDLHRRLGVEIIERDVIKNGIHDIDGTFDVITTFHSMEHWHNSPKALFHQIVHKLNPLGVFVLGVPNCVNMRKRITVPFGIGKWSSIQQWYEAELFVGHVREPDVSDLIYIAKDIGLTNIKIHGRNWLGYQSENSVIRFCTTISDFFLRLRPSFCSDIYLVGQKALG
jgi:SAM-dependent methyltransferase